MSKQPDPIETVTFLATFPGTQGDVKVGVDTMRITLEIPKSEMVSALALLGLQQRECVLEVSVKEA